jgi:putative DNA primase/helicase
VYSIAQLVAGGYLERQEVEQAFEATALQIGLDEAEVQRTIQSAMDAGLSHPRSVPAPSPMSMPLRDRVQRVDVNDPVPIVRRLQDAPPEPPFEEPPADVDEPAEFHLTDLGNAQRLIAAHGVDLHYAHQHGRWLVWDGTRWAEDATAEVERRAKRTVRAMYAQAADDELDTDKAKALVKHALRSESHKAIGAMVALARSEAGIPVTVDQLDRNPWLLNVDNGVLDLRTGDLRSHRRQDLMTRLAPASYDPEATCPTWLGFLDRIMNGNQNLIQFLQRAIGYTLTGSARERVLFMLHGAGANGKSTLLETISTLLGDYAKSTRAETLLVKTYDGGIPNDLAALKGARFVSTSETEDGKRLAEALVKALTGGDTISARFLRGEFFSFRATFKLWLATNHKPTIRGSDNAIWDRIKLIPFEIRIPDEEQDKELPAKLQLEQPGILAWAIRGCLEWQRQHGLGEPLEVRVATANYRQDMDVVATFIEECCVVGDGATERAQRLWEKWQSWCQDSGERPGTQKGFGLRLKEKGFQQGRTHDREQARVWLGLGLAGQAQQAAMDADAFTMQTHVDANPGITGLSAPHVGLSRKSRLHASASTNASANASAADGTDPPMPVCAGCNRPAGDRLGQLRNVSGNLLHDNCTVPPGARSDR